MITDAEWRAIPGASRYEVSTDGQARSTTATFLTRDGRTLRGRGVVLKPTLNHGYPTITITTDTGQRRHVHVHRAMCEAFHGPAPTPTSEARHLDDVKRHNRIENIAWGSKSENSKDAVRNGRHPQARKTACPQGHEFVTTRIEASGHAHRRCRECDRKPVAPKAPRGCSVADCTGKHHSRGWCRIHYKHWWRFGDPLAGDFGRGGDRTKGATVNGAM